MNKPFVICRPPISRVETIARTIGRFDRLGRASVRRLARKPMSMTISLRVYRKDGSLYDQGVAELRDLSTAGARVGKLELSRGDILPPNSTVSLALSGRSTSDSVRGIVVWLRPGADRSYGIRFLPAAVGNANGTMQSVGAAEVRCNAPTLGGSRMP